jgi:hypothetical protein
MKTNFTRNEILAALQSEKPSQAATTVSAALQRYANLYAKELRRHKNNSSPKINITLPEPENEVEQVALELFAKTLNDSEVEHRWNLA